MTIKSKLRKGLVGITLVGALTLSVTGCNSLKKEDYNFNGTMFSESVNYDASRDCPLEVTREDGKKISYCGHAKGLQFNKESRYITPGYLVDFVKISENGKETIISNNFIGQEAIKEAQNQFENYRNIIIIRKRAIAEQAI
jgi:hypothetical protein